MINLYVNNKKIQTLQELKDNFNNDEVIQQLKIGQLANWLKQIGEINIQKQVEMIDVNQSIDSLIKQLSVIFTLENVSKEYLEKGNDSI